MRNKKESKDRVPLVDLGHNFFFLKWREPCVLYFLQRTVVSMPNAIALESDLEHFKESNFLLNSLGIFTDFSIIYFQLT